MLFASFDFLLFIVPVLLGYWLLAERPRLRFALLVLASYFFYAASSKPSGGPLPTPSYFALLLVASTLVDYAAGIFISQQRERGKRGTGWLLFSLMVNLGLLGTFKYTGFLLEVAGDLCVALGTPVLLPTVSLLLPIGISFYTFQSLSYTIDVWRGRLSAERSLLRFSMYVAFFPQLVAGPIVRAADFLPQLHRRLSVSAEDVSYATYRISKGLLKKVLLGDFIAANFTDIVFSAPRDFSSLENLVALYAFTLQIYADFSGYSDIAIGVARLMGFTLPENFDRPHQAATIGEFWRRWHMTLSSWLRDYLFFPLGGSRVGGWHAYFNLWLTMFLVGMWHGASWNFVIYSNLQAVAMLFGRWRRLRGGSFLRQLSTSALACCALAGLGYWLGGFLELGTDRVGFALFVLATSVLLCALPSAEQVVWLRPLHVVLMFHFTVLSRVFFRADDLERAREMVQRLVEFDGHGIRPGLFRFQSLHAHVEAHGAALGFLRPLVLDVVNQGLLILLVVGLGYHFTPSRWLERPAAKAFACIPTLALAGGFAALLAFLSQLLSGPRANIYFAF